MKKIIVTEEEMHSRAEFSFAGRAKTPQETKMLVANEKAGVADNLLWHGYVHDYVPEKREWHFTRLN